jgi:hypothetical protein
MHSFRCMLFAFLAATAIRSAAADIDLRVEASRNTLYLGESFILTVQVAGSRRPEQPDLSALETHAGIRFLGSRDDSRYSIVIVNGQMRKEGFSGRVFSYEVVPQEAGAFTAGPIRVVIDGKTYSDPGPTVEVAGIEEQQWVAIAVDSSKDTVLIDEPFEVTLRIRIKALDGRHREIDPLAPDAPPQLDIPYLAPGAMDDLDGPDMQALLQGLLVGGPREPGFHINNYTMRRDPFRDPFAFSSFFDQEKARFCFGRKTIDVNGERYHEYALTVAFVPRDERSFTFGPVVFKGPVVSQVDTAGRAATRHIFAVGPAATVRVVPPPEEGRPDTYTGAVGTNMAVSAALDTQTCNVGDPLTLAVIISGQISFENMHPPLLNLQTNLTRNFRIYEDTVETIKHPQAREYRYTVRPRHAGTLEFPPVRASYFDTADRTYRTVTTRPLPVRINATVEIADDMVIQTVTNRVFVASAEPAAADAPAAITIAATGWKHDPIAFTWWHGLIAAGGPLLYACAFLLITIRRHRTRNDPIRRRHQTRQAALATLRAVRKRQAKGESGRQALYTALRQYIAGQYDMAAESLTPADVRETLRQAGFAPDVIAEYADLMARLCEPEYARPEVAVKPAEAADKAIALIGRMEQQKGMSQA